MRALVATAGAWTAAGGALHAIFTGAFAEPVPARHLALHEGRTQAPAFFRCTDVVGGGGGQILRTDAPKTWRKPAHIISQIAGRPDRELRPPVWGGLKMFAPRA